MKKIYFVSLKIKFYKIIAMQLFKKKETITQNLTFMAIMAVINVLIAVMIAFTSFIAVFLILFLPLINTLVAYYTKARYYPLYIIATIGLTIVTTLWNIDTTILYVLPSLIIGFLFGLFAKIKINPIFVILVSAFIELGFYYLGIYLVELISDINMLESMMNIFNIDCETSQIYLPSILLLVSFIQIFLSYLIIYNEFKRFEKDLFLIKEGKIIQYAIDLILLILIILGYFFSLTIAYLAIVVFYYFAIISIIMAINNLQKIKLILFGSNILLTIIFFAIFYQYLPINHGLILLAIYPLSVEIVDFIAYILNKTRRDNKIKQGKGND